jgi:alpha-tubulin suppressor-like RCC1 family protein
VAISLALAATLPAAPALASPPSTPLTWGGNAFGQLGDGTTVGHRNPMPVMGITGAIDIAAGREHALALMGDGTVRAWGRNNFGQIGDGSTPNRPAPVTVPGLAGVTDVASGHNHSMALLSNGTVRAWGYNASGQIGDGSTTNRRSPVSVSGLTDVVAIAGGRDMSYAIRSDGTLWAWGLNSDGQLGDGTVVNRSTPVRVGTLSNVLAIAGGRDHGLALLAGGTVWAWGDNAYGQLGDGTVSDRTQPVQVAGLAGIVAVSAGAHHSYALRANGTVAAWGRNNLGQLGDGTTTLRRTPVTVSALAGVASIGSGRDHGLAVLGDGTVRSWGRNDAGQLGDGTITNRTSPVSVSGLTNAVDVHGGAEYSMALRVDGPPDTTPPTPPGQPSGSSSSPGTIDLSWAAALDDVSTTLLYRIFRDGVLAGSTTSSSASVSFTDSGLQPDSTHTYVVTALDAATNESGPSPVSEPITVLSGPSAIFADDFSSGTLANWTASTRFSIDSTIGSPGPPSARAAVSNQTAILAKTLSASFSNLCVSWRVNVSARTGSIALLRVRTSADGPVARVLVNSSGVLALRSDVSGTTLASGVQLGSGWHSLEVCGTVGTAGAWDLYRDGTRIVNAWVANTGTTPIRSLEIGNSNAGTWTANVDDVRVDQTPG